MHLLMLRPQEGRGGGGGAGVGILTFSLTKVSLPGEQHDGQLKDSYIN